MSVRLWNITLSDTNLAEIIVKNILLFHIFVDLDTITEWI